LYAKNSNLVSEKSAKVEKFCIRVNQNYCGNNLNFYSLPFKYMLATIRNQPTELFPKRLELYAPRIAISNRISMWDCYLANLSFNFRLACKLLILTVDFFALLLAECLNTAIEVAVDLIIDKKRHMLAKKAKDTAGPAVHIGLWNIIISALFILTFK
jgi:diacylglycerol kinase